MTGIVILNYNNPALTIQCVESIYKYNTFPIKIVVVDNASTDNSEKVLWDYFSSCGKTFRHYTSIPRGDERLPEISFIRSEVNGGYARGNNLGLKLMEKDSEVEYEMILNNDVLFMKDIIPVLSRFIDEHPEAGLVSPLLRCRDGKTPDGTCARRDCTILEIVCTYLLYFTDIAGILSHFSNKGRMLLTNPELLNQESIAIELPSGSCMMIRKDVFRQIGWFDPNTFLYYEENILYRKLLAEGKQNYMLPGIICIHLGGETTNKVKHSASYMKSSKSSGYYYATHYRRLNVLQRLCLEVVYRIFIMEAVSVKAIKRLGRKE